MGVEQGLFDHRRRCFFCLAKGLYEEDMDFTDPVQVRAALIQNHAGERTDALVILIVAFAQQGYEYVYGSDESRYYEYVGDLNYREVGSVYPTPPCSRAGFRRWLVERALAHRAREEASPTSTGANEAAVRAEECEHVVNALAEYWGVE